MNQIRSCASWWVIAAAIALPTTVQAQTAPTGQGQDGSATTTAPTGGSAANPPNEDANVADIVVTAQKRSERLADVPLSITAVTGDQLAKQQITTPSDLERIVPGFTFQPSGFGAPVFTIRGIGFFDTALTVSPAVSVYLDQVPLPFSVEAEGVSHDLDRLEALKGPQGTLFGENSTGGAINYIAAKPTQDLHAGASLTYGRFNEVDADGFVSGGLSDTLSARISARYERRDDWQYSYTRNDSLGKRRFFSGRGLLDWKPSPDLKFELGVNGWRDKSDTQATQFVSFQPVNPMGRPDATQVLPTYPRAPNNIRAADWDQGADLTRDDSFYQVSLRGDANVGTWGTLTSITAYMRYRADTPTDQDGVNFTDFYERRLADLKTFYQELRGTATLGPVRLTLGGNLQVDHTFEDQETQSRATNQAVGPFLFTGFSLNNNQRFNTKAGFGAVDYQLTSTLTAQGSARYTNQDHAYQGCLADRGGGLARAFSVLSTELSGVPTVIPQNGCVTLGANGQPVGREAEQLNQNNVSWRGSLNWKATPDLLIYGNVTKGYKSGSFPQVPAIRVDQLRPVTQESLVAYEGGIKFSAFNRKLSVSAAGFYYDYHDKQIFGFINTGPPFGNLPGLVNIPHSSVRGGEIEINASPTRSLKLSGGATYIDSKVDSHFLTPDPFGVITDIHGEQFPNTPKWQLVGDAEYDVPLSATTKAFVGSSVRYRTSSYAAVGANAFYRLPGYALLDLRAGVERGPIRFEVFGRNVTDKRYITQVVYLIDTVSRFTGFPATYGATLSVRY